MIFILLSAVTGLILTAFVSVVAGDAFDGSLVAAVVSGMITFGMVLVGMSFVIDAIVEGRIPL